MSASLGGQRLERFGFYAPERALWRHDSLQANTGPLPRSDVGRWLLRWSGSPDRSRVQLAVSIGRPQPQPAVFQPLGWLLRRAGEDVAW